MGKPNEVSRLTGTYTIYHCKTFMYRDIVKFDIHDHEILNFIQIEKKVYM